MTSYSLEVRYIDSECTKPKINATLTIGLNVVHTVRKII